MWTDGNMGDVCIQHDILSSKPCSFTEAHTCVTDKCHQPARLIISCLTTLLDDFQLLYGDGLPCRYIASVRHECATEGVTAFYAMLTHDKVDYGSYRTEHALYSANRHSLFETPITELRSF